MSNVLILGAAGKIARLAEQQLLAETKAKLTLFLRQSQRLGTVDASRVQVIDGDATNQAQLVSAMDGQDIVYANLAGANIEEQATKVVAAMQQTDVKRLLWISTLGIYDEVPGAFGKWNHQMLDGGYLQTYAAAAKVIEASDLDYTIIRPAWLSNKDEVKFETTEKGEHFKGTEVSRKSVADLVTKLIQKPDQEIRHSIGVNKPNTAGDKPEWY
ncbi:SDR family oxidoreductase [Loigolactobacillus binensis]|uniref:SDR family oxidoreductase n=1 Tax=Loigolactobacillus binensis TaxID=2559922 RepID=A0ABW3EGB2_9LACO|nr:SDR family oxidoreductase [Loigolactobacillus binensis]